MKSIFTAVYIKLSTRQYKVYYTESDYKQVKPISFGYAFIANLKPISAFYRV